MDDSISIKPSKDIRANYARVFQIVLFPLRFPVFAIERPCREKTDLNKINRKRTALCQKKRESLCMFYKNQN